MCPDWEPSLWPFGLWDNALPNWATPASPPPQFLNACYISLTRAGLSKVFSEKGQAVNSLDFVDHAVSVTPPAVCCCRVEAVIDKIGLLIKSMHTLTLLRLVLQVAGATFVWPLHFVNMSFGSSYQFTVCDIFNRFHVTAFEGSRSSDHSQ